MSVPGAVNLSKSSSRIGAVNCLESLTPEQENPDGTITAAATTGPASGPRPASSIPATNGIPFVQSSLSNRRLHGMPDIDLSIDRPKMKSYFFSETEGGRRKNPTPTPNPELRTANGEL